MRARLPYTHFINNAAQDAQPKQSTKSKYGVDSDHRDRDLPDVVRREIEKESESEQDPAGNQGGINKHSYVTDANVTPNDRVSAQKEKRGDLDEDDERYLRKRSFEEECVEPEVYRRKVSNKERRTKYRDIRNKKYWTS